jgi:ribonuclease III
VPSVWSRLFSFIKPKSSEEKALAKSIHQTLGISPINITLYKLATQHSSVAKENIPGHKESNERLEYLGDAVLSAVIADYLFKKYPYRDEGFLTEIRSRIVNRESLNLLGKNLGLNDIVVYNDTRKHAQAYKSILGDTLEAFIGAVYLDKGYRFTRNFVIKKLLLPHLDIDKIIEVNPNFKSKVIEWAHKNEKTIRFEVLRVKESKHFKEFISQVFIDDAPFGKGTGFNKKRAEQEAAEQTCKLLDII